ncbi:MAG: PLP-dependent aspartate aminotransferase family protein [Clostridiales bacterium]|jgi:cystathionine gamma-synthase|nr:PLP-dependent aspartate aminotransferase family protein [Clostridiales bacterium]
MEKETVCVHGAGEPSFDERTGAVSVPIYQSATFRHPELGKSTGFDYSRMQNPTRLALEQTMAALENGTEALAYTSGMAAIANLMEIFVPGDHILASEDLYGGGIRLFRNISEKNGLKVDYLDTGDLVRLKKSIAKNTRAVFIETPSNPMMLITDIGAVAELCHKQGILVIVDNTFLTPYFQKPLDLGADIVVHSGTKFLCGHNDTLSGFLITNKPDIGEKLRFISKTVGSGLPPFDSWLMLRGIKTLALRMERQQENAFKLAEFLLKHPRVSKVFYAGLPGQNGYDVMKKQASGFGSMISFETDTEKTAVGALKKVKLISFAESLGGVESLITYPAIQTHADVPEDERNKRGINNKLLRLSVGIENADDLIADLNGAL